jgi:hypothetical protein
LSALTTTLASATYSTTAFKVPSVPKTCPQEPTKTFAGGLRSRFSWIHAGFCAAEGFIDTVDALLSKEVLARLCRGNKNPA